MKRILLIGFILLSCSVFSQSKVVQYGPYNPLPRNDEAMNKWRDNRFGQFIHWGLYSIPGGIWKGKTYSYAAEFLKSSAHIPASTWDSLAYSFNPINFNAKAWAKMAKNMGVRYATITTKHHEGFCMWPSEYTNFTIALSPIKRDILKEFVDAYTAEGIDVNLYYSVLDWHHPDWRYDLKSKEDTLAFDNYKLFVKNQLLELLQRYPKIKAFWFDGTWDACWKKNGKFSYELEKALKEAHPGLIVNSRMRADEYGSRGNDSNGNLMGDYAAGYERRLPDKWDVSVTKTDWECCMTIPDNQWGYHKDWSLSHIKRSNEIIEMLSQCVSQNGNFLLNFGPKADGTFRTEEMHISKEIAQWMKVNGSAIYGCTYAGLKKQDWGYFTKPKDALRVNMIVCNQPIAGNYRVILPKGQLIEKAYLLDNSSTKIAIEEYANYEFFLKLGRIKTKNPFVIVLQLANGSSKSVGQKVLQ